MNDKQKTAIYIGGAVLLVLVLKTLKHRNDFAGAVISESNDKTKNTGFATPYLSTNPGIPDMKGILNGGNTYSSVSNIMISPNLAMQLNRNYIPLFGFVGIQTVGVREPVPVPSGQFESLSKRETKTDYDVYMGPVKQVNGTWYSVDPFNGQLRTLPPNFSPTRGLH